MEKLLISLTDNNGKTEDYELLDIILFEGLIYSVFYPTKAGDTEVMILRVDESENLNESIYSVVDDENIINEVYKLFKEKYKNEIQFID